MQLLGVNTQVVAGGGEKRAEQDGDAALEDVHSEGNVRTDRRRRELSQDRSVELDVQTHHLVHQRGNPSSAPGGQSFAPPVPAGLHGGLDLRSAGGHDSGLAQDRLRGI